MLTKNSTRMFPIITIIILGSYMVNLIIRKILNNESDIYLEILLLIFFLDQTFNFFFHLQVNTSEIMQLKSKVIAQKTSRQLTLDESCVLPPINTILLLVLLEAICDTDFSKMTPPFVHKRDVGTIVHPVPVPLSYFQQRFTISLY